MVPGNVFRIAVRDLCKYSSRERVTCGNDVPGQVLEKMIPTHVATG